MTSVSFSECLENNMHILGTGASRLGKIQKSGFLGLGSYKLMLSHNAETGWSVAKLNIFQLFFRKLFGAMLSTHGHLIHKQLHDIIKMGTGAEVFNNARVNEIWQKRFFKGVGNADVGQSNLFVFPEEHTDYVYRKTVGKFISDHYRKGDVILVEGQKASKTKKAQDHEQTRHVTVDAQVQGWEPENFDEYIPASMKRNSEKAKEIGTLFLWIAGKVPTKINNQDKDLKEFYQALPEFIEKYHELAAYFQVANPVTVDDIKKAFKKVFEKGLDNPSAVLKMLLLMQLRPLEEKSAETRFTNITAAELVKMKAGIIPRNKTLCKLIEKTRAAGNRVFVIAGEAHILRQPWREDAPYTHEIKDTMRKHSYVVLSHRARFERLKLGGLNPELQPHIERKLNP